MKTQRFRQFGLASLLVAITITSIWLAYRVNTRTSRALGSIKQSGGRVEQTAKDRDGQSKIEQISFQGKPDTTNEDLIPIRNLRHVYRIDLDYTEIDDISPIRGQLDLRWLDLEDTNIDSEQLVHLEELDKLYTLVLTGTKISDEGLQYVADMTELRELRLDNTAVTDACLVNFRNLGRLREINLRQTNVTRAGIQTLQQFIPDCEIKNDFERKDRKSKRRNRAD